MQISLDEAEIREAVIAYAKTIISIPDDKVISVEFTAGRGANGLTGALSITASQTTNKVSRLASVKVTEAVTKPAPEDDPKPDTDADAEPETDTANEPTADDIIDTEPDVDDTADEAEAPAAEKPKSIFAKAKA